MKTSAKKSVNLVFAGALILTLGNLLVKVIGALLKVPLQHSLGDDGMAYYNVANKLYVLLFTISTAGLPTALALMTSRARAQGNLKEAKKIFRVALIFFCAVGLLGTLLMMLFCRPLASSYKGLDDAWLAILLIAPTVVLISVSSAFRGYYQGYQHMIPTAVSEIIEAVCKLSIGLGFANYAITKGYPLWRVAAYSVVGLTVGVALGMVFLIVYRFFFNEKTYNAEYMRPGWETMPVSDTKKIVIELLLVCVPITLSSSVMSLTDVFDGMIVNGRLASIGYDEDTIRTVTGNYETLALTMFKLPPTLIAPITAAIVPHLSALVSSGRKREAKMTMDSSLRVVSMIAMPCAIGLSALSYPILSLLFNDSSSQMAAPLLSVVSIAIIFLGVVSITGAILQAHRYQWVPIISMILGGVVKLISSFILIGIPAVGMMGSPISNVLCYLTIMVTNFWFIKKLLHYTPDLRSIFLAPLLSATLCGFAALGVNKLWEVVLPGRAVKVGTLVSIAAAGVVYVVALFLLRGIRKSDILLLPKGQQIYRLLCRVHLMKEETV